MASNAENVFIWWRHHVSIPCYTILWRRNLCRGRGCSYERISSSSAGWQLHFAVGQHHHRGSCSAPGPKRGKSSVANYYQLRIWMGNHDDHIKTATLSCTQQFYELFCIEQIDHISDRTKYGSRNYPTDTRRNDNVKTTSRRRFDVIITLLLRHVSTR